MKADSPAESAGSPVYVFGDFRLDLKRRQLFSNTGAVGLTPRVLETLISLVQSPGTLLSRERLMDSVWPETAVEPNNLSQSVTKLRRVLGERPGENRFIETVPGRGYRFIADVRTELSPRPAHDRIPLRDAEADRLLRQALRLLQRPTPGNCRTAIEQLEQVLALAPDSALAWAWFADAHLLAFNAGFAGTEVLDGIEDAAKRAIALEPATGTAHTVIGTVRAHRRDWLASESHFMTALSLNEGDAMARTLHASFLLLQVGHVRRTLAELRAAFALAPDDPRMLMNLAMALCIAGHDDEALRCAALAIGFGYPQSAPPLPLVFLHAAARAGRYADAAIQADQVLGGERRPNAVASAVYAALEGPARHRQRAIAAITGFADEAFDEFVGTVGFVTLLAEWLTQLGRVDLALDILARAVESSLRPTTRPLYWQGLWLPELRPLRRDPRFGKLAARLGLTQYWSTFGSADD